MKQIILLAMIILTIVLAACEFHTKQPKDDTYYKRTQSVSWPESK